MKRIDWDTVVKISRRECADYISKHGIAPTLRGLFYILVSKNIIPNTKTTYTTLSAKIAEARYFGKMPWDYIRDETRIFISGERGVSLIDAEKLVSELENLTDEDLRKLVKEQLETRASISLSRWENQQYSILIVVEKQAQLDAINKIVNVDLNWDVYVTTSRGFESATAVKHVSEWIINVKNRGKTPVLLLVFDWDPSGEYAGVYDLVFRVLGVYSKLINDKKNSFSKLMKAWRRTRRLSEKGEIVKKLASEYNVLFEKIMLTEEQVKKYNLPPVPESQEALKKLERDPRKKMFVEKYGLLGQVEIEALIALYYSEAVKILNESISKYFDENKYRELQEKEKELREKARKLLEEKTK